MDPLATDYNAIDRAPSWQHWLGTDGVGGDLLSRLLYGLRVPLLVAAVGTTITLILGTLIGVTSGYRGGLTDALLSRGTDVVFAFPGFLLALVVAGFFGHTLDSSLGGSGRVLLLIIILALVSWPSLMRVARSMTLILREQEFVDMARAFGCSDRAIIARHLLPNLWGPIAVQGSFIAIHMIGIESALSLFGLGVQSPNPDLGVMLFDARDKMALNPWELVVPGVTLSVIILAGTFIANGLRDAFDPRI
jgi:peptide/nickel transport system permease protein